MHIGINPILFTLGSTEVRWYGIMTALAVLTVVVWTYFSAKKAGIPGRVVYMSALWAIPFGIVISRLVEVIDRVDFYSNNPGQVFSISGLTIYGAILGGAFGAWIYHRINGYPFGRFADAAAPGVILAQAVGRVGCAINGCCYGTPTTLPWGFIYTNPNSYAPLGISTHPTVVYELFFDLAVFGMLLAVRHRFKPEGTLFLLYLATYSGGRFFFSYLRENATYGGLREAQIIALAMIVLAVPLLIYKLRQQKEIEGVPLDRRN